MASTQPKGGRGESPLACIDNTGKEGQGGDVCNFFMVLGKSVFRINPTVFMKMPASRHSSHVRECKRKVNHIKGKSCNGLCGKAFISDVWYSYCLLAIELLSPSGDLGIGLV